MSQENNNELKYVLYARRSIAANKTEEDKGVPSIESQLIEVNELAKDEGRNIVKQFNETVSASTPGMRPEFNKMIDFLKSGKANAIICFKMDRLARNSVDEGVIKHLLQTGVIKVIRSVDREWKSDDHTLVWSLEFGTSTQYVRDLKVNIRRGQKASLRRGFRPGLAPMGYKNTKYREKGMDEVIEVDKEIFDTLRKMFDYVLSNEYTPFQVLTMATEEWGLRSRKTRRYFKGKPLSKSGWYSILSNPFYYGEFQFPAGQGEWYKGSHKPLITRAEFATIQQILNKDAPRPKTHTHIYTGLMRCGKCGARVTCEDKVKKQKNGNVHYYSYYHCTGQVDHDCHQKSIRQEELEKQITDFLSSVQISDSFHNWAIGELKSEYERERNDKTTILYNQNIEYMKVQKTLETILEMRMEGQMSSDRYEKEKGRLELEERRLADQLEIQNERVKLWIVDAERTLTFAEHAVSKFNEGSAEKKRAILAALGTEHVILDKKLTIKTEKPLLVVKEMVSESDSVGKPLEPALFLARYGPNGKNLPTSPHWWRWGESNSRVTRCEG